MELFFLILVVYILIGLVVASPLVTGNLLGIRDQDDALDKVMGSFITGLLVLLVVGMWPFALLGWLYVKLVRLFTKAGSE